MALVEIRDVHKVFQRDSERIEIFTGLSLDINEGSFTALMGPSGSGKSTLLNLLAGLDKPTSGTIRQEQRVAIARAIVADPTLVLLDEPTGQLDAKSSQDVLGLLQQLNAEFKKTIIVVTHDARAAERAKTVLHLEKGILVERQAMAMA